MWGGAPLSLSWWRWPAVDSAPAAMAGPSTSAVAGCSASAADIAAAAIGAAVVATAAISAADAEHPATV